MNSKSLILAWRVLLGCPCARMRKRDCCYFHFHELFILKKMLPDCAGTLTKSSRCGTGHPRFYSAANNTNQPLIYGVLVVFLPKLRRVRPCFRETVRSTNCIVFFNCWAHPRKKPGQVLYFILLSFYCTLHRCYCSYSISFMAFPGWFSCRFARL